MSFCRLTSWRCSRNLSPNRLPVSSMYNVLQRVQVIQRMTLVEVQVKWLAILMDRFGPDNFSTLQIKGHVLHRARAHLKVPGWLLVWNALLTKKLPMFWSRLFLSHRVETQQNIELVTFAVTWSANIFVGCLADHFLFWLFQLYLKTKKKPVRGKF